MIKPAGRVFLILANVFLMIYWLCAFLILVVNV
jgi:hypothetical protein